MQPWMLRPRPHRSRRARKVWIREGADRNHDQLRQPLVPPEDRRTAIRAEIEGQRRAALGHADEFFAVSLDGGNLLALEKGAGAEHGAGPPLAGQAVAGRHQPRCAVEANPQLPAGAARLMLLCCHP